jgi:hypothetical protein
MFSISLLFFSALTLWLASQVFVGACVAVEGSSWVMGNSPWLIFLFVFVPMRLCEDKTLSFTFTDAICERSAIQEDMKNVDILFVISGQLISQAVRVSQISKDLQVINCVDYGEGNGKLPSSQCERKEVIFVRKEQLGVSFLTHSSGKYLEVCLLPDILDMNSTNSSKSEPTSAPSIGTRVIDLSGHPHPFMSTQAILIPLIFFALIVFGGLSYHFELYRHLPYCAKPRYDELSRVCSCLAHHLSLCLSLSLSLSLSVSLSLHHSGFLHFEDEFSASISEEEEGVVNFDCPVPPSSPNSYAVLDRAGLNSPTSSKTQLRRHVDTFTNRIDDMLSAAREGVSKFPTNGITSITGGLHGGHHRLAGSDDGLESGHNDEDLIGTSQTSEDDPNEEEVTIELMTL